jgi:hypothetical protein
LSSKRRRCSFHTSRIGRRAIVSDTGYLSHFAPMADIKASASPEHFARDFVLSVLEQGRKGKPSAVKREQLSLF